MNFELQAPFIIQLVSFFVLAYLLNRLLFEPFGRLLEEREQRTAGDQDLAASGREEAQQMNELYEQELKASRAQAQVAAEEVRSQARVDEAAILEKAREEAASNLAALRKEVWQSRDEARSSLKAQSEEMADEMVKAVLGGQS
ncbi:MAG: ATP synthase F0 subunit B [Deltaproteobacteria bacterium]|nr:ATP synthase F0 subunit B [Deltaproteobacteria bacterium]